MADPPPPSYSDAITGDYSHPTDESSSPSSRHPPSSSRYFLQSTQAPSAPPTVSLQLEQRTGSVPPRQEDPSTEDGVEDKMKTGALVVRVISVLLIILVLGFIIKFVIWPTREVKVDTDLVDRVECAYEPPAMVGGTWKYCSRNDRGRYSQGTRCNVKCDASHILIDSTGNAIDETEMSNILIMETARIIVYYTCKDSEWISNTDQYQERRPMQYALANRNPRRRDKNLQCLKRTAHDCKIEPPRVIGASWIKCSKNGLGEYTNGTMCSFKCDIHGYVLSSSRGVKKYSFQYEQESIQRSGNKYGQYASSGVFTCTRSQWVSSVVVPQRWKNKLLECVNVIDYLFGKSHL